MEKEKVCKICNLSPATATGKVKVLCKGFEIFVPRGDDICAFCAKTEYLSSHERELSDPVFQNGKVDWKR